MSWRYRAHKKSRATQNAARKGLEWSRLFGFLLSKISILTAQLFL